MPVIRVKAAGHAEAWTPNITVFDFHVTCHMPAAPKLLSEGWSRVTRANAMTVAERLKA